jgi:Xaa-Pro dipeptidase
VRDRQRLDAILDSMEQQGVEYLVAFSDNIHPFLEPNPAFTLSGFKPVGESAVILGPDGNLTLLVNPSWDYERAQKISWTDRTLPADDLIADLHRILVEKSAKPEKTGFVGVDGIRHSAYSQLVDLLDYELISIDNAFIGAIQTKNVDELDRARKATWIAERGYEYMLEIARPGLREYQLAAELDMYMKALGADDNFLLMSASQHNLSVRAPGNRILQKGDIILAEISPSYRGQFVQICRTLVIGEASQPLREKYQLLIDSMECGMETAKPGVTASQVMQSMNEPLDRAGYGEYSRPPYMRVRGHGLGITSVAPGEISDNNPTVLMEEMMFIIQPNQYLPETGYLLCGEPVVVTPRGAEPLTQRTAKVDSIVV